ncbi:MAG: class I SAM-dependent methyltransferase [Thermoactinomyces sp.]
MSNHYFSAKPEVQREERKIQAVLLGRSFTFYTDAGVFSKRGIDFGSRLLIETVKIEPESRVLDLGCGYGAIGIAIGKTVPHVKVTMVDINERAVQLAKENAVLNQVEDRVEILVSDRFAALEGRKFDHILLNPPIRAGKKTVYRLFEEASNALDSGGSLWIVIRKQQGAVSAKKELEQLFSVVNVIERKKGYWVIWSRND